MCKDYSYSIHNGILEIYVDDFLLATISDCDDMTTDDILYLIDNVLYEHNIELI